jgi:outer membrane protein TolC
MVIALEPALAGPGPISVRDWDSQSKRRAKQQKTSAKSKQVTTNFAPRKTEPQPEPTEYAASDVQVNEERMSAEAMRDTAYDSAIVQPVVVENASAPVNQPVESLDTPIAEPSNAAADAPVVQQAKRLTIEEAANLDRDTVAALETSPNEAPHVLMPSVGGFEHGEGIEQYTQLTSEPIQGGEIKLGDETISLNDATIDQLFEEYEFRSTHREMLRVSLEDCLRIALVQNLDIQIAEFDPQRNDGDLMQARGEFDPSVSLSSTYRESQTSPSAQTSAFTGGLGGGSSSGGLGSLSGLGSGGGGLLGGGGNNQNQSALSTAVSLAIGVTTTAIRLGAQLLPFNQSQAFVIESEGWQHSAGVSGKTHYGTEYELRLDLNVEEGTYSGGAFEWDGGLTLQLTQPLLKGRGKNANLARIRTSKNSRISSEYQLKQTVEQSLSEVIKTYWDLVGAYEQLRVAQRSLSNAEQLRNDNEQRFEIGSGNQLDVVQAKASVAERQGDVINQINQVTQTENRLKQLLDLRDEFVLSPVRLVPTQQIPETQVLDIDEGSSIQRALDNKPDIQSSMLEAENASIELKRANNELLPDLDLQGSYFTGGRGDKKKEVFEGLERRRDETWSLGLRATIPITNRQARGSHTTARVSKLQADRRLIKAQQEAIVGVKQAIASVGSNRIAVEARAESRVYQETNVDKQETSLKLGATTSFEVLRTQEDLANAEAQEVQSRIELEKSMVDLELAEGTILENNGIEFVPPEQAEAVPFFRSLVPPAPAMN